MSSFECRSWPTTEQEPIAPAMGSKVAIDIAPVCARGGVRRAARPGFIDNGSRARWLPLTGDDEEKRPKVPVPIEILGITNARYQRSREARRCRWTTGA